MLVTSEPFVPRRILLQQQQHHHHQQQYANQRALLPLYIGNNPQAATFAPSSYDRYHKNKRSFGERRGGFVGFINWLVRCFGLRF